MELEFLIAIAAIPVVILTFAYIIEKAIIKLKNKP